MRRHPLHEPAGPRTCLGGDAETRAFLLATLSDELGRRRTVSVTVPAPVALPERVLSAMPGRSAVLFAPPGGISFAGLGSACRIDLRGAGRLEELAEQADAFFARLCTHAYPGCQAPSPRFFGGLSFLPGTPGTAVPARQGDRHRPGGPDGEGSPWEGFGDGWFALPRWRYASSGTAAWLTVTLNGEADLLPQWRDEVAAELDVLQGALLCGADPAAGPGAGLPVRVEPLDPAAWVARIEEILRDIAQGRVEKIVAARRTVVDLPGATRDTDVLLRLHEQQPACARFAFRRASLDGEGGVTFLGATPERLVRRRGDQVECDALAGSIALPEGLPGDGSEQARRLLASDKDAAEHALVVHEIAARLRPFCSSLRFDSPPQVRRLRQVLHLHTAIDGELRDGAHVLTLLAALHPTPAVGGVPRAEALRFIAAHEERGWYAGPVGWFDATGDGEFAVAIRSGLLDEKRRRAHVYAGAGIVRGSDPLLEYEETAVKQVAFLRALGATGAAAGG